MTTFNPFLSSSLRLPREVDGQFASALAAEKAVVRLLGPRRVGKTDIVSTYARLHGVPLLTIALKPIPRDVNNPGAIVASLYAQEFQALAHTHKKLHSVVLEMEATEKRPNRKRSVGSELGAKILGLSVKLTSSQSTEKAPAPTRDVDPDYELAYALRRLELAAVRLKLRPVVFFDEIQELVLAAPSVPTVWAIRNEIQHHTACRYVFAGSNQRLFAQLDSAPQAPLLHVGTILTVPRLSEAEVDAWAVPLFRRGGRQVDSLAPATALMAGKIGEVVKVCSTLWATTKPGSVLHDEQQREALLRTIQTQETTLPSVRSLSANETRLLRFIGLNPGASPLTRHNTEAIALNPGTIHATLDALVTKGLVEAFSRNEYTLATPLSTLAALEPMALTPSLRRATVGIATAAAARLRSGPGSRLRV